MNNETLDELMRHMPGVDPNEKGLFYTYNIEVEFLDDDHLVELVHRYARTKKSKHIKEFIKYIGKFRDDDLEPYDLVLVAYRSYKLSKLITRKRGKI